MKLLKRITFILLIMYGMITTALYFFQEKLLFFPTTLEQDYTYNFDHSFEEVFLQPEENVSINALHFKAKNPKGVLLYFHGNAGDLSRWGVIATYFVDLNYDVFIIDYRTYGKSTGPLSEEAFYNDAQYAYNYLLEQYEENQITVYGRSLGTGIATYVASKNNPKQLILETPYYNIADVAKKRFPIFPIEALLKYRFPSNEFIKKVNCPITIFHGTEDRIVPYESGKKLSKVAPENTVFITIDGGFHNNLVKFESYKKGVTALLK